MVFQNYSRSIFTNSLRLFIQGQSENSFKKLPFYNDLLIFQPKNATGDDLVITDEVGGTITFSQTDVNKRPIIFGNLFQTGDDRFTPKGFVSSSGFGFFEIFIFCNYGGGSTFSNFQTLLSGTGTTGAKRIMGNQTTADLNITNSVNDAGLVRINQSAETTTILPLTGAVLHSCSNFTTPVEITDAANWTIGFNSQVPTSRGWSGENAGEYSNIGCMIFSKIALNNTQRLNLNNAILSAQGLLQ